MEEDSPVKGAVTGLATGTIWGTIVATWYDVPRVERHVTLPGLIRTIKMCGTYGAAFATIGGLYIRIEQLVQSEGKKRDFVNGAAGAFVAGATVCGYKAVAPEPFQAPQRTPKAATAADQDQLAVVVDQDQRAATVNTGAAPCSTVIAAPLQPAIVAA